MVLSYWLLTTADEVNKIDFKDRITNTTQVSFTEMYTGI